MPDLHGKLERIRDRVVQNLEAWEKASPDPNQVFVACAGGEGEGNTKSIHEIVEDVRNGTPDGEELLDTLLDNMLQQAMDTEISASHQEFDADAFDAELRSPYGN
ncbi:hypothetical protein [Aquisphaera insulae]|uniref:hypothetical protein n=1 Tax=Aquisphaera insulae TaxID=2712864 RepID=UPI0013EA8558|nr:hypothetical protein [Aquisphaera insulae]